MDIKKTKPLIEFSNADLRKIKKKNISIYNTLLEYQKKLEVDWKYQRDTHYQFVHPEWIWEEELIGLYKSLLEFFSNNAKSTIDQKTKFTPVDWFLKTIEPEKRKLIQQKSMEMIKRIYNPSLVLITDLNILHEQKNRAIVQKRSSEHIKVVDRWIKAKNKTVEERVIWKARLIDRIIKLKSIEELKRKYKYTYSDIIFAEEYICFLYIPIMREKYPWGEIFFSILPKGIKDFQKELILRL